VAEPDADAKAYQGPDAHSDGDADSHCYRYGHGHGYAHPFAGRDDCRAVCPHGSHGAAPAESLSVCHRCAAFPDAKTDAHARAFAHG
jgi:hypothetical protein